MKSALAIILLGTVGFVVLILSAIEKAATQTAWVGHPMISDADRYTPSQGWLTHVEIGLRSDGVVVWRKIKHE